MLVLVLSLSKIPSRFKLTEKIKIPLVTRPGIHGEPPRALQNLKTAASYTLTDC